MLSSRDLYKISNRLSAIRNNPHVPFGGINIILCGDFAQLPPVKAIPLYDHNILLSPSAGSTAHDQEVALGKTLWHQFITVVILQQNMRQTSMLQEDFKYRTALENM
ncbi:hypothetical protein M422DRAFT_190190 [Sphaerobolus stellatus SS14]|uniref:ATP-dependent DNA helicase n=1 Tax=Sphaerobolus stellatus (strain SS14) TaxID=990650 RepID=A0A0C9USA6_SPHS4|nr:hypothetical protein M422DRAFT_190190 [Sphaerobolus stellatus SS14]